MIKLVIFDLDGTLLNTLDDLADSCNYILKKHGFATHEVETYRYFVGNGVGKLVERALPEDKRDPNYVETIRQEFVEYYSLHAEDKTAPYPGIVSILEKIASKNIKMAVASNKFIAGTRALVKKYFENIEFSSVIGQRDGIPVKPNPQIVYDVMEESGILDKNEILYIGDSGADMKTAVNAGVQSVGVLWGFRSESELIENGAEYLVSTPNEILDILSK